MQACRLRSHTVDVTPPQAAIKIMAGMAERQKEWQNGRMAEMDTYILFMVHADIDTDDTDTDTT